MFDTVYVFETSGLSMAPRETSRNWPGMVGLQEKSLLFISSEIYIFDQIERSRSGLSCQPFSVRDFSWLGDCRPRSNGCHRPNAASPAAVLDLTGSGKSIYFRLDYMPRHDLHEKITFVKTHTSSCLTEGAWPLPWNPNDTAATCPCPE